MNTFLQWRCHLSDSSHGSLSDRRRIVEYSRQRITCQAFTAGELSWYTGAVAALGRRDAVSDEWDWEPVGDRLQTLIKASGLSQLALAEGVGISQGYLSDLISGKKKNPSLAKLVRLARALGTSLDYLLTGQEPFLDAKAPAWLRQEIRTLAAAGRPVNAALVRLVIEAEGGDDPVSEDEFRGLEGQVGAVFMRGFKKTAEELTTDEWRDLRQMIAELRRIEGL